MLLDGKEIIEDEKEEKQKRTEGSHSQGKAIYICKSYPYKNVFFSLFLQIFQFISMFGLFIIIPFIILMFLQSHYVELCFIRP